jgi:myxalamid-type polyketide synthase MxaE and MxaD
VLAAQADVSRRGDVAAVLARIRETLPPLRGVVHAAAVLDDSTLLRLDVERLQRVMQPKIDGARHLHDLTSDCELDFFVLFSSAASILGSPGQGNYAAANAYLDALAQHRRAQGRPALSVNWGPWADIGLAASQANRGDRLAAQGMASIPPEAGLDVLGRLLACDAVQVAVMPFDLRHWRQLFPSAARAPFLRELFRDDGGSGRTTESPERARLLATPPALRQGVLETMLAEQIARVLRMPPDQIDRTTPLPSLGLDSLMALELRNRLELSFGVTLSATLIWGYPTIGQLAPFLAEKLGLSSPQAVAVAPDPAVAVAPDSTRASELAAISDEEAEALLAQKLSVLDEA